jgi:hypothetical protein
MRLSFGKPWSHHQNDWMPVFFPSFESNRHADDFHFMRRRSVWKIDLSWRKSLSAALPSFLMLRSSIRAPPA